MVLRCPRGLKRACRRRFATLLQCLPQLPACIWDCILSWRLGNTPPAVPEVLFVQEDGKRVERLPLAKLPQPAEGVLRIVIVSDTHERHRLVQVPPGDIFLHCGDILMSSSLAGQERGLRVLRDFNSWLSTVPCREKVVIGGNHDRSLERLGDQAQSIISAAFVLQDESVMLSEAGIKVYGNAWSRGHSHNRAWQTDEPQLSHACQGADIVMTHLCSEEIEKALLAEARPRLWASGHCHEFHGVQDRHGILFVNASIHDRKYNPVQPPVVVDLLKSNKAST
eukprot:TRINITY_DN107913_c0_g1_i1.p1 TRINITY_DN107913_c0_g1~~TRINITY_DN107913_c0_g1_i1.p1  ORF type:complete len:290 (+),score=29.74 TRINITY_DN107913_c0_g1_i1:29-871(+)